MDASKIAVILLVCLLSSPQMAKASKITFEASPTVLKGNLTEAASMRCELSDTEKQRSVTNTTVDVGHVTSILITDNEGRDVAQGSPFEAPLAMVDPGNLQVKGVVSPTSSEGYLQLTWATPALMATGQYVCEVHTIDSQRHVTVFRKTLNIEREEPSINDIVAMLQTQNHLIKDLQDDNAKLHQANTLLQQANTQLQQANTQMHQENTKLKQEFDAKIKNCSQLVAFQATSGAQTVAGDDTVVFPHVWTNEGAGYDNKTGVFTCSVPGVYKFDVVVESQSTGEVYLLLNHNSNVVGDLFIGYDSNDKYEQGSMSAILELNAGDRMKVTAARTSMLYKIHSHDATNVFNGHMIRAESCQP